MSNIFKTPLQVVQEMLDDYKSLTGIPLSPSDYSRDEVVKAWTFAGAMSGLYAQARRNYDDKFPASASEEGLIKHLAERQLPARAAPSKATGVIPFTGDDGTIINIGDQVKYIATGAIYQAKETGTIAGGIVDIECESVATGANQNITDTAGAFSLVTSIAGADATVFNSSPFLGARDLESVGEMLQRIETYDQDDNTGGNPTAYETWAREASAEVVSAKTIKNNRGLGTVDTIITSGTTDFETAIRDGTVVTRLPGSDLINTVQAYIILKDPTTDNHQTIAPTESTLAVTINYDLYDEALRSIVDAEIDVQTKVFLYSAESNSVIWPTQLERLIDKKVGHLIKSIRVTNWGGSGGSHTVPAGELLKPGVITKGTL